MTEELLEHLKKMREPFQEHQISQLPKPMKKREEMDKLPKATCKVCGGYHATSMMMHLSYVGHAALTDRMLDVDPEWKWEPLALDAMGLPALDRDGGLWIKLTVCGVTRLGYGDAPGKSGGDAMKERIGDALRNAAMRFGAALDLWHKGELHVDLDDSPPLKAAKTQPKPAAAEKPATTQKLSEAQIKYFPRAKAALDTLHGTDTAAKKATIFSLSYIPAKDDYPARPAVEDYRELDGKRIEFLTHTLEAMAKKAAKEGTSG